MSRIQLKILSVFCFLYGLMPMQGQETFFEFIPGWEATGVYEMSSGTYRTNGSISNSPGEYNIIFNDIGPTGNVLGSIESDIDTLLTYGATLWNSSLNIDDDLFLAGTCRSIDNVFYGFLARFNVDLDLEDIVFQDSCCFGNTGGDLLYTSDDHILFTGYPVTAEGYRYTTLSKYSTNLNRQWTRNFYCEDDTINGTLQPYATTELADGGILLTTLADYFVGGDIDDDYVQTILIRCDANGNEMWRMRPGDTANYWIEPGMPVLLDNGNIMAFWSDVNDRNQWLSPPNFNNTVHFGELDSETGEMLWEDDLDDLLLTTNEDLEVGHLYSLKQTQRLSDGSLLITGYDLREAMFIKMDQTGQVEWIRFHLPDGALENDLLSYNIDTWLYEVQATSDGGFVGVGEFRVDPGGVTWPLGIQSAFIIKLDEDGCLLENCLVGLAEHHLGKLDVYPNPTNGMLRVEVPGSFPNSRDWSPTNRLQLEVLNQLGMVVSSMSDFELRMSNDEVEIDLSDQPTGLYHLRLIAEEGVWTGKVMKE